MVNAVGLRNYAVYNSPDTTEVKDVKEYRNSQEQTGSTKVNFEGRRDYDVFEPESHTGRNVAIGTGVAALALYVAAAIAGKKGFKFKGENWFAKTGNACTENAYKSVQWLKEKTWDKIAKKFKSDKPQTENSII